MNRLLSGLFVICVLVSITNPTSSEADAGTIDHQTQDRSEQKEPNQVFHKSSLQKETAESNAANARSQTDDEERVEQRSIRNKPLRSIVMGIYKNYKSTYLGNKTLTEYKQTLRESMKTKQQMQQQNDSPESGATEENIHLPEASVHNDDDVHDDDDEEAAVTDVPDESVDSTTTLAPERSDLPSDQKRTRIPSTNDPNLPIEHNKPQEKHYNVGPALNMSLDLNSSIVKVNLDGESLKELVTGRWLNDNSDEGRGKKYEMVTRILPLFILPFLIQSAIVPFLVTKLKLLLMKSMLVGKLAIFLLIISAFRNSNKMLQTYEVAPSYWASEPSRRSEMAAAASSMAYNGYRVEGKPTAWIN